VLLTIGAALVVALAGTATPAAAPATAAPEAALGAGALVAPGRPLEPAQPAAPPSATPSTQPAPPPLDIQIPSLKVRSSLIGLRLNPDETMQVPKDYAQAGWFAEGPAPGDPAPAVIVGHVDSKSGPAVFYRLREMRAGDETLIRRADGTTARFVVDRVETYSKNDFPSQTVFGPTPRPELRLITCTGDFDAKLGSYESNLVVFAHLDGTPSVA